MGGFKSQAAAGSLEPHLAGLTNEGKWVVDVGLQRNLSPTLYEPPGWDLIVFPSFPFLAVRSQSPVITFCH
jgi:hypothetical protein